MACSYSMMHNKLHYFIPVDPHEGKITCQHCFIHNFLLKCQNCVHDPFQRSCDDFYVNHMRWPMTVYTILK